MVLTIHSVRGKAEKNPIGLDKSRMKLAQVELAWRYLPKHTVYFTCEIFALNNKTANEGFSIDFFFV